MSDFLENSLENITKKECEEETTKKSEIDIIMILAIIVVAYLYINKDKDGGIDLNLDIIENLLSNGNISSSYLIIIVVAFLFFNKK